MTVTSLAVARSMAMLLALALALAAVPASAAPTPDTTRPKVAITTEDGAVLLGPSETTGMWITGTASDDRAIREVQVVTIAEGDVVLFGFAKLTITPADLSCRNQRRSCTWKVPVPSEGSEYQVLAYAVDRAGNRRKAKPVDVIVAGPPILPLR